MELGGIKAQKSVMSPVGLNSKVVPSACKYALIIITILQQWGVRMEQLGSDEDLRTTSQVGFGSEEILNS